MPVEWVAKFYTDLHLDIDLGSRTVNWGARRDQSKQWEHNNKSHTLALSAFYLSSLKTIASKKELVKEMWDSGAEVIVSSTPFVKEIYHWSCGKILLDHGTSQGFANIIEAREYLLQLGKLSSEDAEINDNTPVGCYIVAPVFSYSPFRNDLVSLTSYYLRFFSVPTKNPVLYLILLILDASSLSDSIGRHSYARRNMRRQDMRT